jgi:hypothetical protein
MWKFNGLSRTITASLVEHSSTAFLITRHTCYDLNNSTPKFKAANVTILRGTAFKG